MVKISPDTNAAKESRSYECGSCPTPVPVQIRDAIMRRRSAVIEG